MCVMRGAARATTTSWGVAVDGYHPQAKIHPPNRLVNTAVCCAKGIL